MELGHAVDGGKLDDQEGDDMTPSLDRTGTAALLVVKSTNNELSRLCESSGL
jgi:hypothetical protein